MTSPPAPEHPSGRTRHRLTRLGGGLLVALGLLVLAGWLWRWPALVRVLPGMAAMTVSTAAGYMLAGLALMLSGRWRRAGQRAIGAVLLILALVALWQLFTQPLMGVNHWPETDWLQDPHRQALVMPLNLAMAFALAGAGFLLSHLEKRSLALDLLPATNLAIGLIGLTAVIDYLFNPDLLPRPSMFAHMAPHTVAGLLLLSAGLWLNADRRPSSTIAKQEENEDRHILLTGAGILVAIALISGIASFLMLERQTGAMYKRTLELTLRNRIDVYDSTINQGLASALAITTRPAIRRELQHLQKQPGDPAIRGFLQTAISSFLDLGFKGLSLRNAAGQTVVNAGQFAGNPGLRLPLSLPYRSELLWQDGLILRFEIPMTESRTTIGSVIAEWPATLLNRQLQDIRGIGETGEMVVCGMQGGQLACFPTRLQSRPFTAERSAGQIIRPMSFALDGATGLMTTIDYRQQPVLAAYGPIGATGLGMVIKMDLEELYRPIYQQLQRAVLLLVLLVGAGLLLLRWRLLPLVRRLVETRIVLRAANTELRDSEARVRAIIEGTTDAVYIKDTEGRYLLINSAGARTLGRRVEEVLGRTDNSLFPANSARQVRDHDQLVMETGQAHTQEDIVDLAHGRRVYLSNRAPYRDADGNIIGLVGISRDITERKRTEEEALSQSLTDELTGLYNRRGLLALAAPLLERENRTARGLYLFFADLDGLKEINDRLGHSEGDQAIQDTAHLLSKTFRDSDIVARFGGDEFVILAPDTGPRDVERIQARLQERLAAHNREAGRTFQLALTVGAVRYDSRITPNIEALLARADQEMYRRKGKRRR